MIIVLMDILLKIEELGLVEWLLLELECKIKDDIKLVCYICLFCKLYLKILLECRVSCIEIFNVIFGDDEEVKVFVYCVYNKNYCIYFGKVKLF